MVNFPDDWSSPSRAQAPLIKQEQLMQDFIEDFDDDDDAFFNSAEQQQEGVERMDTFEMLTLNYNDAATASPLTSANGELNNAEIREIAPHLSHLQNSNSSYRNVVQSCLIIHQSLYPKSTTAQSTIIHHKSYEQYVQRVIESLSTCLSSHQCTEAKILSAKTLGTFLRSCLAKLDHDLRLQSEHIESSLEGDILGAAYALINAAIEGDDYVSSTALHSLGVLTIDNSCDGMMAEIYSMVECGDPNSLIYSTDRIYPNSMKDIRFKIYNHVVFPRMAKLLARFVLYAPHHLGRVLPVITAAFESALTEGEDTIPPRRSMSNTKTTHAKRGWMETDATQLVAEYVELVLGCLDHKELKKGAAIACVRLANVCPLSSWSGQVSKHAVTAFVGILNDESALISTEKDAQETLQSTLCVAATSPESLAGTVGLLLVALRGIPLSERAAGLILALKVVLLYLPIGMAIPTAKDIYPRLDVPLFSTLGETSAHRLGRVGLLTEIALLIIVDGNSNISHLTAHKFIEQSSFADQTNEKDKQKICGARAVLANHVLQSDYFSSIWESLQKKRDQLFRPIDELIWVFCSTLLQSGQYNEHAFAKDFSYLIEWSNIALVMLDNFGKFVSRPRTPSPFSHAAHLSYVDLMAGLMKRSGLVPPPTLSIRDNMLPSLLLADNDVTSTASVISNRVNLSVVGGPGRQMPHVSSALSKICQNMLVLLSEGRTAFPPSKRDLGSQSTGNIVMTAMVVDAWLGKCITNYDAKLLHEGQLEAASNLLARIETEMNSLLESHDTSNTSNNLLSSFVNRDLSTYLNTNHHLFRVCMASLEIVAKMSVMLWNTEKRRTNNDAEAFEERIGPLAVSILHAFIQTSKNALDISANAGKDVLVLTLYQQIAIDANDTIARIVQFNPSNTKQSYHDDITTFLQPSPFLSSQEGSKTRLSLENMLRMSLTAFNAIENQEKKTSFNDLSFIKKLPPTTFSQLKPMEQCAFFLYHHARLLVMSLISNTIKASLVAFSSNTAGPPKDIHPLTPHRMSSSFEHTVVEVYSHPPALPVMIPALTHQDIRKNAFIGKESVSLTGCSDAVSLTMTYDIRRVRKGDLSEEATIVATMRLYNVTPVPIRNGVKLDLKMSSEEDSQYSAIASSVLKDEIKGGDFVTWETTFSSCKVGNISLEASITFRDMGKETITSKWVSVDEDMEANDFIQDDNEERSDDITLTCRPVLISGVTVLQPCPLVFFGSKHKQTSHGLGDDTAFYFLWSSMSYECSKSLVCQAIGDLEFDDKRGYIICEAPCSNQPASGCAFISSTGVRVLCLLESKGNDSYLLNVRSDSLDILQSLVGHEDAQSTLFAFLFGSSVARILDKSDSTYAKLEHDFISLTLSHQQANEVSQ